MTHGLDEVRRVADDELLSRLERLVKADRAISVKLLVHLGEVETRKLYLERGYSSMYDYCMTALGMSEAETYLRLLAAKTGKRLPLVLDRLAEGGLHLTAIKLLAPLLTQENHVALLDRARGMSKRQLEVLVAELAPKPDVPERLRKLPDARGASAAPLAASAQAPSAALAQAYSGAGVHVPAAGGAAMHAAADGEASVRLAADGGCEISEAIAVDGRDWLTAGGLPTAKPGDRSDALNECGPLAATGALAPAAAAPFALQSPSARASISPLSPGRFKLELTLGQEAYDQLAQLRELLRHQNPSGEITRIVERALRELLERTLKQRFAQTGSPRRRAAPAQDAGAPAVAGGSKAAAANGDEPQSSRARDAREASAADALALPSARSVEALEGNGDACLAARPQQLDARVVESVVGAGAADESHTGCSTQDSARDDAALGGASPAAAHQPPAGLAPDALGAATEIPRASRADARSRYVPRDVLREVYARDGGQCSYVSADGRRCPARGFLEVHHHEAFARGGEATFDNLRLACRAHNFWLAERELGRAFVQGKLRRASSRVRAAEINGG
jgi:hypothetical protein